MTTDLKARLDAMVREQWADKTWSAATQAVALDLLSKLDAAEAKNEKQKSDFETSFRESLNTITRLTEERNAAEAQVTALAAERDALNALLMEWEEPGGCGCDTFSCKGTCLVGRTRAALKLDESQPNNRA